MRKAMKIITYAMLVSSLALTIYIMINQLGIIDTMDFGAGAYYYTDIPEFEKYLSHKEDSGKLTTTSIYFLFAIWGFISFKLWKIISRRMDKNVQK